MEKFYIYTKEKIDDMLQNIQIDTGKTALIKLECNHSKEVSGYTGHTYGVAIPKACQMTFDKIHGHTAVINQQLVNSRNDFIIKSGLNHDFKQKENLTFNHATNKIFGWGNRTLLYVELPTGTYTIKGEVGMIVGSCDVEPQNETPVKNIIERGAPKTIKFTHNGKYVLIVNFNDLASGQKFQDLVKIYAGDVVPEAPNEYRETRVAFNADLAEWDYVDCNANRLFRQTSETYAFADFIDKVNWQLSDNHLYAKCWLTEFVHNFDDGFQQFNNPCVCDKLPVIDYQQGEQETQTEYAISITNYALMIFGMKNKTIDQMKQEIKALNPKFIFKSKFSHNFDVATPRGYGVYNGGLEIQTGLVPYTIEKIYPVSVAEQLKANVRIDNAQQQQINQNSPAIYSRKSKRQIGSTALDSIDEKSIFTLACGVNKSVNGKRYSAYDNKHNLLTKRTIKKNLLGHNCDMELVTLKAFFETQNVIYETPKPSDITQSTDPKIKSVVHLPKSNIDIDIPTWATRGLKPKLSDYESCLNIYIVKDANLNTREAFKLNKGINGTEDILHHWISIRYIENLAPRLKSANQHGDYDKGWVGNMMQDHLLVYCLFIDDINGWGYFITKRAKF